MGIVHQLSPQVANCIAAGEVVENPASVVKELCENAIDAGATEITISIRNGGLTEIVVSDNGCGMSPEDAETAFLPHATSKLRSTEDLNGIVTLGFRGEALASISAVSLVTLETRREEDDCGTLLELEYGEITRRDDAVIMPGTTFTVREIFGNTPARLKFLRSNISEGSAVIALAGKLALSHPEISFTMKKDNRINFTTSGSGDPLQTIIDVCGREFADVLVPLASPGADLSHPRVWGYITTPAAARASRIMQFTFLNGRSIHSTTITSALEEAYHTFQPAGKFPGCVLHVAMDPSQVDINVHPSKMTVKFARDNDLFSIIYHAVCDALREQTARPAFTLQSLAHTGKPAPAVSRSLGSISPEALQTAIPAVTASIPRFAVPTVPSEEPSSSPRPAQTDSEDAPTNPENAQTRPEAVSVISDSAPAHSEPSPRGSVPSHPCPDFSQTPKIPKNGGEAVADCEPAAENASASVPENVPEASSAAPVEKEIPDFRIAGVLYSTYIIVEAGDEVVFIDFHATHERIRYNKLLDEYRQGGIAPQLLLSSVIVPVSPEEFAAVREHQEELLQYGVEAEPFGERDIAIRALPPEVHADDAAKLLTEICRDFRRPGSPSSLTEALLHRVACHSAVRGGDTLSDSECRALAARVLSDPDLRTCPHGRPVAMIMKKRDFIRNFER